jgi:hypothetical protein
MAGASSDASEASKTSTDANIVKSGFRERQGIWAGFGTVEAIRHAFGPRGASVNTEGVTSQGVRSRVGKGNVRESYRGRRCGRSFDPCPL